MQFLTDPLAAKEHDAKKSGLEEKGRQHLIGHERADDWPRLVGKHRPVGAELVGHHNARDDPHAEGHREDLLPVGEQGEIGLIPRAHPKPVQDREVTREPNGEGWEDDVERDCEGELEPCQ